ncbi:MAG: thiol peroxidase [Flavobacterium sp.]|nr:MAG: thiol peroxidase [Flavobacterium sp.]
MSQITLGGNPIHTNGELPQTGSKAADFSMSRKDLSRATLADYAGKRLVLNIFPSIDTSTCAQSVRVFNQRAAALENTKIINVSRDLPFAQKRFCGSEGIDNAETLSDFNTGKFGKDYGLEMVDGALAGLHARAVIVVDEDGTVIHTELVPEIADEPNYDAAIASLK